MTQQYQFLGVSAPGFCAGIIFCDERPFRAAPILWRAAQRCGSSAKFRALAARRGWQVVELSHWSLPEKKQEVTRLEPGGDLVSADP